jgi:hypothetical protein
MNDRSDRFRALRYFAASATGEVPMSPDGVRATLSADGFVPHLVR